MNKIILIFRQLISYFCVGGTAALVEWLLFAIFTNAFNIQYLVSTCLAFIFSTFTNWLLGRNTTFKGKKKYDIKKECISVFFVSAIGLLFNILLMYAFVEIIGFNSAFQKSVSKMMATGIVFFWNFSIRRFVIYR